MKDIILPQTVAIGLYNAQVVFKNKAVSPNRKTAMFEIELPMEDGGMSFIDDTSHPIMKNAVICAKPGQLRHTRLPFKCYYIHMILTDGLLFHMLSSFPNFIELSDTNEIKEIFISLCEYYSNGTSRDDIMIQSLILRLIFTLDQKVAMSKKEHHPKPNNHGVIEQTVRYIKDHPAEDLSLASLAERANFSLVYFHKLFKASTGKNLRDYVEEQRIKKAIDLLISTNKTLTQIAYECGFSSQSHFSYVFKRRMGLTPREYAKHIQLQYEK